ncbi:MAG: transporter permease [Clostridia bacterium]|nr:transporter permease [Clostridia bacterium]
MTLFNMAFKNIRRNFNNYFIYFVSMVFSIMIYHIFTSIQYNEQIVNLQEIKSSIFITFKTSSIVIAIFAGIFIWYSNSFFIKKRKKEVALYSLMGVKKRQIGRMLFYENLMMGMLALTAGVLLGSLLSKLFIMLLLQLMGYSIHVKFAIQLKPIINTAIMFSVLFLITSVHSYSIIYKFKLIDLFKAENIGDKEPKASWIASLLGLLLVGGGYFYYLGVEKLHALVPFITLALVVTGTYLLFSSLTVYIIKLAKKNKVNYYSGTNLISTSQLMYRLKGHARTLATIAVLSATTLTAMGVTSSFYYDFQTNINKHYPFSYAYVSDKTGLDKAVDAVIAKYPEHAIKSSVNYELISFQGKLPNVGFSEKYRDKEISVMSEKTYNEIAKARGLNTRIYLDFHKDILFIDTFYSKAFMKPYKGKDLEIKVDGEVRSYQIKDFQSAPLLNERIADYLAVVDEDVYEELREKGEIVYGNAYIVNNAKDSAALTDELYRTLKHAGMDVDKWPKPFSAFYDNYKAQLMGSGLTIFVGAFLGLVFLLATGSIIFFKQLSEANEDKKRYGILRNVGFDKKDIKSIISKQMLFVFMLPLAVGITHSIVAVSILKKALGMDVFVPLTITIGVYTLIYMIYYLLTVDAYGKLVENGR